MADPDRRECVRILVSGIALGLAVPGFPMGANAAAQPATAVVRRLRSTIQFQNPFSHPLDEQAFWCYLPMNMDSVQRLRAVDVSMPYRIADDEYGHHVLELILGHVAPFGQKIVTVSAEIDIDPKAQFGTLPHVSAWLGPERFIECDDIRIREFAMKLRRASDLDTVRAIYEWTANHVEYAGYLPDDLGALYAYLQGRGDCTEFADLVVALARANNIPARMVEGYVTEQDAAVKSVDYHNWAEVFLDGAWHIVDAQKRNWLAAHSQYVAYRIYRDATTNPVGHAHRYRLQGDLQIRF